MRRFVSEWGTLAGGIIFLLASLTRIYFDGDALLLDIAEGLVPMVAGVIILGISLKIRHWRGGERILIFLGGTGLSAFAIGLTIWRGMLLSREGIVIPMIEFQQLVLSGASLGFLFGTIGGIMLCRIGRLNALLDETEGER